MVEYPLQAEKMTHIEKNPLETFCNAFFTAMNAESIRYCVLRGFENLPFSTKNDIDIGLEAHDVDIVLKIIKCIAPVSGWHVVSMYQRPEFCRVILFHQNYEKVLLPIDLVSIFSHRGIRYANLGTVLQSRQFVNGFFAADPAMEAATSIVGRIFTARAHSLSNETQTYYRESINNSRERSALFLKDYAGNKLAAEILLCIDGDNWSDLNRFKRKLLFNCWKNNGWTRSLVSFFSAILNSARSKFLRRGVMDVNGGLFVVLLGPDGSGKTSLAEKLMIHISPLFNDIRYYHGRFKIFPRLSSLLLNFRPRDNRSTSDPLARRSISKFRANINIFYYGLEYFVGHFIIFRSKRQNNLVLCDRYFYDYHLHPEYKNVSKIFISLVQVFIPKPDVVILLKSDPEIIFERKQELSKEEINRQQNLLNELVRILPNVQFVRTDCTLGESLHQAKILLFSAMVGGSEHR